MDLKAKIKDLIGNTFYEHGTCRCSPNKWDFFDLLGYRPSEDEFAEFEDIWLDMYFEASEEINS